MNDGSGLSSRDSFAQHDPHTSSWKTSRVSLLDGGWESYLETWPPSGMTRNGQAYRLPPLVPRTSVGESLLWPTPTARDWRSDKGKQTDQELYGTRGRPLPRVAGGMLNPTWVEWLMGFPAGWTELEPSETP